jgi:hypothetical protein
MSLLLAIASTAGGLGMLAATLYGLRRSGTSAAREEALALAATRLERIRELEARLAAVERAYRLQRLTTLALVETLADVDDALGREPPDLDRVRRRLDALSATTLS